MVAANIRRLMAQRGLTQGELAERAGVNVQTLKQLLRGEHSRPHARTLHKLAAGLSVSADELFRTIGQDRALAVDRETNPIVDDVLADFPQLCGDWSPGDFRQLYSCFGAGGSLTYEGALETIKRINQARAVQEKVAVLLETEQGELLREFVELLYRRIEVRESIANSQSSG